MDKKTDKLKLVCFLVETAELESATPCMSSKYSNQLSYASVFAFDIIHSFFSLVNAFLNFVPIFEIKILLFYA